MSVSNPGGIGDRSADIHGRTSERDGGPNNEVQVGRVGL